MTCYAEYGSLSGEKDTVDMDEIISALGKTGRTCNSARQW